MSRQAGDAGVWRGVTPSMVICASPPRSCASTGPTAIRPAYGTAGQLRHRVGDRLPDPLHGRLQARLHKKKVG